MSLARLIYARAKVSAEHKKASSLIGFTKGKQPSFADENDGMPYLTIEAIENGTNPAFSSDGISCEENDVLMVMDGAASGHCYFGYKGFVGSTMAKITCKEIDPAVLYFSLEEHEKDIQKNTTGSAIPHTDKRYVGDLLVPLVHDENTLACLHDLLGIVIATRKVNKELRKQKALLMEKYF